MRPLAYMSVKIFSKMLHCVGALPAERFGTSESQNNTLEVVRCGGNVQQLVD